MTNHRRGYREILAEFISIYQSEPCLWQVKSKEYHNRTKKTAAYRKLVDQLRLIEPSANREMVVRKINGLRTNYRKEKRKIEDSIRSGSSPPYEPTLWYYDLMKFLDEDYEPTDSIVEYESFKYEDGASDSMERISMGSDEDDIVETASTSITPRRPGHSRKRKLSAYPSDSLAWSNTSMQSVNHLNLVKDDRFDIFGKNVAMKLRDLPKQQRLIAEKIINETLFEAEMGTLTLAKQELFIS